MKKNALLFLIIFLQASFTARIFYHTPSDYYIQHFPYKKYINKTFGEFNNSFTLRLKQRHIQLTCYADNIYRANFSSGDYDIKVFVNQTLNDSILALDSLRNCACSAFDTIKIYRIVVFKNKKRLKLYGKKMARDEWLY